MPLDHETSERAYQALKRDVLAGDQNNHTVNISALARRYGTSATPVREALLRLVGERLIALPKSGGFRVERLERQPLRELYELNLHLLVIAARMPVSHGLETPEQGISRLVPAIDLVFARLAERTGNRALFDLVTTMNDKLHYPRLREQRTLPGLSSRRHVWTPCEDASS